MLFLDKAKALDLIVWNSHRVRLPGPFMLALEPALSLEPVEGEVPFWQELPFAAEQRAVHLAETPSGRTTSFHDGERPLSLWR